MESLISRHVILSILFLSIISSALFLFKIFDNQQKLVFCDVGQGDGVYIRLKNSIDILIDAGPESTGMSECLNKNMQPFDKTIDYVFITHPQIDHYGGLISVFGHYTIKHLYVSPIISTNVLYTQLLKEATKQKTDISPIFAGNLLTIKDITIYVLWPTKNYIKSYALENKKSNMYAPILDDNNYSLIMNININQSNYLLTGDAPIEILEEVLINRKKTQKITILKVSHHGSLTGLSERLLDLADPTEAVISCGRNNKYKFPNKNVLKLLQSHHIIIRRTDKEKDIIYPL
ncbi:MAG: MBL fold metallo-hydrolase [Candidatus Roizmanbacteria bacterium]